MKPVFADTSYFIALVDADDAFHQRAIEFSSLNRRAFLVSSAVILELGAHFSRAARHRAFIETLAILARNKTEIMHVNQELQHLAIDLFAARSDKDWSLTDCISFLIMQDRGLSDAATSDEHFQQAGFTALLRLPADGNGRE